MTPQERKHAAMQQHYEQSFDLWIAVEEFVAAHASHFSNPCPEGDALLHQLEHMREIAEQFTSAQFEQQFDAIVANAWETP